MKLNNEVLKELVEIERDVKQKTARIAEIKEALKARGSFSTSGYVCIVQDRQGECLVGLKQVEAAIERKTLEILGLIKAYSYKTVTVSPKENLL